MSLAVLHMQIVLNRNGANLKPDGVLGNNTIAAINALNVPIWVKNALKEVGVKEIVGGKHSARVLEYHATTTGKYKSDEIAWCGSSNNFILIKSGFKVTVSIPERAKSWELFGQGIKVPVVGAIAIKSRKGGGHVGIVLAVDGKYLYLLGGNQGNEYNIRKYLISDFDAFRLPHGYYNAKYTNLNVTAQTNTQEA
ncbi:MAG: TIGR02594 family protein [Sulfurovaceae bacterium]